MRARVCVCARACVFCLFVCLFVCLMRVCVCGYACAGVCACGVCVWRVRVACVCVFNVCLCLVFTRVLELDQRSSMTKIFHSSTTAIPLLGGATYTGTILSNAQLLPLSEQHCPMAPPSSGMAVVQEWNILVILNLWLDYVTGGNSWRLHVV